MLRSEPGVVEFGCYAVRLGDHHQDPHLEPTTYMAYHTTFVAKVTQPFVFKLYPIVVFIFALLKKSSEDWLMNTYFYSDLHVVLIDYAFWVDCFYV